MKKIKIVSFAMACMMLFGTVASAATFKDMPSDERTRTAIENAVANGLISGYPEDNTVRPDNNIRRSEMAVIITQACKVAKEGDLSSFTDVTKNDWFYSAMAKGYEMGAFRGNGDGTMNPYSNITFQECFTVLSQVFDLLPAYTRPVVFPNPIPENQYRQGQRLYDISVLDKFTDKQDVANWAKPYVAGVVANGGWDGIDGKITPTAYITRAQFAIVMDNLIKNYIDEPGTYTELPEGNTMIRTDGVVLENVRTEYDLYIGDNVSANGITINNINSFGRIVVRGCATPTVENGVTKYGDVGIKLTGAIKTVRVIRPYIFIDMRETQYGSLYVTDGSTAGIPFQIQ